MPRIPGSTSKLIKQHVPLAEDYSPTVPLKQKASKRRSRIGEDEALDIDDKETRRIRKIGQELIDEDKQNEEPQPNVAFTFDSRAEPEETFEDDDEAWGDEDDGVEEEADQKDQDIFERFHPSNQDPSLDPNNLTFDAQPAQIERKGNTDLASLILSKIAARETGTNFADPEDEYFEDLPPLPEKAVEAYETIGHLLSRQRSGPLPKPFKILPTLPQHQIARLIDLTNPQSWTPYAHYMSTRQFISSRPDVAQPYLTTILLPKVREEIADTKKLHVHLYAALKKALYRPACFFKGILFPLLEDGTCTLREAHIISSVVSRVSVPVLHSAAALLRLCDIAAEQFTTQRVSGEVGGPVNVFIRCLLDKKYALPYKVVDALVFNFIRLKSSADADDMNADAKQSEYKLTVIWHQALLSFAQRYRNDITEDQREALLDLVKVKGHAVIGPEVRRELLAGRGRGVVFEPSTAPLDGDDTMMTV